MCRCAGAGRCLAGGRGEGQVRDVRQQVLTVQREFHDTAKCFTSSGKPGWSYMAWDPKFLLPPRFAASALSGSQELHSRARHRSERRILPW